MFVLQKYDLFIDWDNFCSSRTHFKDADSLLILVK